MCLGELILFIIYYQPFCDKRSFYNYRFYHQCNCIHHNNLHRNKAIWRRWWFRKSFFGRSSRSCCLHHSLLHFWIWMDCRNHCRTRLAYCIAIIIQNRLVEGICDCSSNMDCCSHRQLFLTYTSRTCIKIILL